MFNFSSSEPPIKTKPPSPPASSSVNTVPSADVKPSATSSPKEEPNGLEEPVNGGATKRPHSPTEEDLAKKPRSTDVREDFGKCGRISDD